MQTWSEVCPYSAALMVTKADTLFRSARIRSFSQRSLRALCNQILLSGYGHLRPDSGPIYQPAIGRPDHGGLWGGGRPLVSRLQVLLRSCVETGRFSVCLTWAIRLLGTGVGRCDRGVQRKCTFERRSRAGQVAFVIVLTARRDDSSGPRESDSRHTATCGGLSDLCARASSGISVLGVPAPLNAPAE